ncbi:MAG: hypothetical protein JRJ84_12445 [Deltaproteobacteria bacterium]|nr:hypothetical protein [Deltaproteobacteria bacterium]
MTRFLPALALLALTGCWSDKESIGNVAWSDDDVEQAYIEDSYEYRFWTFGRPATRNWRHRVMLQSPDGTHRRFLTPIHAGQNGSDFYFMRQEGYVLYDVIDGAKLSWKSIDVYTGNVREVHVHDQEVDVCPVHEVIPSPDGRTLARVGGSLGADPNGTGSGVPGDAAVACTGGTLGIDLLDANTLQVDGAFEVEVTGWVDRMWTRAGDFHVWDEAGHSWRIDPVDGPVAATKPTCFWPRTSSSTLSSDGVLIEPGDIDDPVVVVDRPVDNCW